MRGFPLHPASGHAGLLKFAQRYGRWCFSSHTWRDIPQALLVLFGGWHGPCFEAAEGKASEAIDE